MKSKLFASLVIFSLLAASLLVIACSQPVVEGLNEDGRERKETEKTPVSSRTWERVVILDVQNFTRVETFEIVILNISLDIVQTLYTATVNSTVIDVVQLDSYLPAGSFLFLLFENATLVDYLEA